MEEFATNKTFKSYMFFWSGQLFSLLGSMIVHFVLIWWIQVETRSPTLLSLGQFFMLLPTLIFMPIAGVLSDKWKRKNIILVADSLQAYLTLILIILFILNVVNIWLIFLFIGLRSIFQAFHQPTVQAIIPSMVPREKLSRINGVNFLFVGLIQLIGPGLAALLLQFFTFEQVLWVDVITFLIAFIPLVIIKIPDVRIQSEVKVKNSFIKDLKEGFNILKLIPGLLLLIFVTMLANFLIQPLGTLLPYYVNSIHGGFEAEYALVLIFLNGGIVIGAIFTTFKKHWKRKIDVMMLGIVLIGIGYGLLAFAPIGFFLFIGLDLLFMGLSLPIINTIYQTILQTNVPKDKLGRVTSIDATLSMVISPLGSIIAGPITEVIGINNLFLFCSILLVMITLLIYFLTNLRHVNYNKEDFSENLENKE